MAQCIKRILLGMVLACLTLFTAPGDLDTTFGSSGVVSTFVAENNISHRSVAIQGDSKIVRGGQILQHTMTLLTSWTYRRNNLSYSYWMDRTS